MVNDIFLYETTGSQFLSRPECVKMNVSVKIKRLPHSEGLDLPVYATIGAAGVDLLAAIDEEKTIFCQSQVAIPTGISVALPKGYELQIRPRSGLAYKHGIMVVNSPGTIDEDYRGEIFVILLNTSTSNHFTVTRGMRIAQAVVAPVVRIVWDEVDTLDETVRGDGKFGSTGV